MLITKSEKQQTTEGTELPNQRKIRTLREKENYKYLVILEVDHDIYGDERIKLK